MTKAATARSRSTTGDPTDDKKVRKARKRFLSFFPGGFRDSTYVDWERSYKWEAHRRWDESLHASAYRALLKASAFHEIAQTAVRIESRTNLLFSFEKMALRDAVKSKAGARIFAEGLYKLLHGGGTEDTRFDEWCHVLSTLPRKQTRVVTWPIATVFGFLAKPERHIFLKPNVTRRAALSYGFDFNYSTRPSWNTYASLLTFAETVRHDVIDLHPRDLIDLQSFIWVQGSDEYD